MDGNKFDSLTRALGAGRSRRGVLKTLGAAALGAIGLTTLGEASAAPPASKPTKCYGDHSSCTNGKQCCSGTCTNRTCAPATPVDPCAGQTCDDGNPCTTDSCSGGVCSHTPVASGTSCGNGKVCSQFGVCNGCGPAMNCPPAPSSCQINSCDVATNTCGIYNVAQGTPCDSNAGTCDGAGTCIHPVDPCAGVTCPGPTECASSGCVNGKCQPKFIPMNTPCTGGTCDGAGVCQPTAVCTLALGANCTEAGQCCPNGAAVACGPVGNLGQPECCRPLGAACANVGAFQECCATVFQPGVSGSLVYCAANHTCGGAGAMCSDSSTCASGLTCLQGMGGFGQCG